MFPKLVPHLIPATGVLFAWEFSDSSTAARWAPIVIAGVVTCLVSPLLTGVREAIYCLASRVLIQCVRFINAQSRFILLIKNFVKVSEFSFLLYCLSVRVPALNLSTVFAPACKRANGETSITASTVIETQLQKKSGCVRKTFRSYVFGACGRPSQIRCPASGLTEVFPYEQVLA